MRCFSSSTARVWVPGAKCATVYSLLRVPLEGSYRIERIVVWLRCL